MQVNFNIQFRHFEELILYANYEVDIVLITGKPDLNS